MTLDHAAAAAAREGIGGNFEVSLRWRFDIGDSSRIRNAEEVILAVNWDQNATSLFLRIFFEVKAPGLRGLAAVLKRFKGNFKLADQPKSFVWVLTCQLVSQFKLKPPAGAERAAAFLSDLAVVFDAGRIGAETKRSVDRGSCQ